MLFSSPQIAMACFAYTLPQHVGIVNQGVCPGKQRKQHAFTADRGQKMEESQRLQ